jgi:hypothetical protein
VIISRRKLIKRATELIRLRHILGIKDDGIRAIGKRQRGVERLRFGPRSRRGCDYHCERLAKVEDRDRMSGFSIIRLDDELHIKLFQRIIRYYGANATRSGLTT